MWTVLFQVFLGELARSKLVNKRFIVARAHIVRDYLKYLDCGELIG